MSDLVKYIYCEIENTKIPYICSCDRDVSISIIIMNSSTRKLCKTNLWGAILLIIQVNILVNKPYSRKSKKTRGL